MTQQHDIIAPLNSGLPPRPGVPVTRHPHLDALEKICRQSGMRDVFPEEIIPHLTALAIYGAQVERLGESLLGHLRVRDRTLRHDSIMGCVEAIFLQVERR